MRRVRRLVVLLILASCVAVVPSSGHATTPQVINVCPEHLAPDPEPAGGSVATLLESPLPDRGFGAPEGAGRYQQVGVAGMQWHTIVSGNCADPRRAIATFSISSQLWDLARYGGAATIFAYQLGSSDVISRHLADLVEPIVHGLRDGFFRSLITTAVFISAIWLAWVGLVRKRMTLTMEGTAWMIMSMVLGFWVMASPASFLSVTNGASQGLTFIVHDALSSSPAIPNNRCIEPGGGQYEYDTSAGDPHFGGSELDEDPENSGSSPRSGGEGGTPENDQDDEQDEGTGGGTDLSLIHI